jgi:hypothetical protein
MSDMPNPRNITLPPIPTDIDDTMKTYLQGLHKVIEDSYLKAFDNSDFVKNSITTSTGCYVDRGDPVAWDKSLIDFTTDGAWHDLDLSAIVPAGATAVVVLVYILDNAAGSEFDLKKAGVTLPIDGIGGVLPIFNQHMLFSGIVDCSIDRKIQYWATNTTWTDIYLVVTGWFK